MATGLNRTNLGDLLMRQYTRGKVVELENLADDMWAQIQERPGLNSGGDGLYFDVLESGDQGFGFLDENEALQDAQNEVNKQARVRPKIMAGVFRTSGLARRISTGGAQSFVNGLQQAIDMKIKRMVEYLGGACFRDGTGLIGLINEPSSVPDTTSGNLNIDGGNIVWFFKNMVLQFHNPSTGAQKATAKVTAVDFANQAITLDTNIASLIADNDEIFRQGAQPIGGGASKEISGFGLAIATTGTYLNLDRSLVENWDGNVIDASSAVLDEELLQQADDRAFIIGGGKDMLKYCMHPFQARAYFALTSSLKRFAGIAAPLDAGYSTLSWMGREIFVTRQCQEDRVFGINVEHFFKAYPDDGELQIERGYGGTVLNWDNGFDGGVGYIVGYPEVVTDKPNAHFVLNNLAVTSNR